ncbi:M48 family metallopeptidase [Neisseria perflava]|uniref:M48 family metallopeptidase n=1 Tax=Neisseria perflava TaxID=33053 RepID=UPI00209CF514|nr:SprT family zinc-dependent metalloprotease [Neisseria perflava]MCP1661077.1 putative metal-dependent hydrolase [Neisseria perflava]
MPDYTYTFSDGQTIAILLKRSAKKNLILRPVDAHTVSINLPPYVSGRRLQQWLRDNEPLLRQTLAKTPAQAARPSENALPDWIWYHGVQTALREHSASVIQIMPSEILLPHKSPAQQSLHLRRFLHECASEYLLPRLARHAATLDLHPAALSLSNAKTFWGVCRARTGIRLNWRLVGAPDFVADYVCVHELCHLPHPDHSPRFWALVNRHTPHTEAAKAWLKAHGKALFVLG